MSRAPHPSLAPLLAGGGTPERLAALSGELSDRLERLLSMPRPRLLDDDILAPLTAPPAPGSTLEAALARLTGGVAETGASAARGSMPAGDAALSLLPADIATHAHALARPAGRAASPPQGPAPVGSSRPPVAAAKVSEPAVPGRPILLPVAGREWQTEAARLGADRPLSIAAEPPTPPASSAGPGGTEAQPASRRTGPVLATGDPAADGQLSDAGISRGASSASSADSWSPTPIAAAHAARESAASWTGISASPAEKWGPAPIAGEARQTSSRPPPISSTRRVRTLPGTEMAGSATRRPRLPAVDLPKGARIGGFAGLASLGRAAAAGPEPADPVPSPAPARSGQAAPPTAVTVAADRPPPLEAQAVIAELTDMLRLQVLAAGIDLSGRRS